MKSISIFFVAVTSVALPMTVAAAPNQIEPANGRLTQVKAASIHLAQMQSSEGMKQREKHKAARPEEHEGQMQANPTGAASPGPKAGSRVNSTTDGSVAAEGTKGQDRQNAIEHGKNPATADH